MEEALGLTQAETPEAEDEVEEEISEADLKRILRRKLVFERRARGDTAEEIVSFCQKKGYPVTQRTVFRDLKSDEVASLIDELVRVQLRDIALLRGYALEDPKNPNLKALAAAIGAGLFLECIHVKRLVKSTLPAKKDSDLDFVFQFLSLFNYEVFAF
jgi:hypothetical protein